MIDSQLPSSDKFLGVMERTIQIVGDTVPRSTLQKVAEVLNVLHWEFQDYAVGLYFLVDDAGEVTCSTDWTGKVDSTIRMDAETFHNAANGKTNFGTALLMGKLHVEGLSAMNLGRFISLLKPFLDGYQQACVEFHDRVE